MYFIYLGMVNDINFKLLLIIIFLLLFCAGIAVYTHSKITNYQKELKETIAEMDALNQTLNNLEQDLYLAEEKKNVLEEKYLKNIS